MTVVNAVLKLPTMKLRKYGTRTIRGPRGLEKGQVSQGGSVLILFLIPNKESSKSSQCVRGWSDCWLLQETEL